MKRLAWTIRDEAGLTLAQVCEGTTIDPSHLARFEKGYADLSSARLLELSQQLSVLTHADVTINALLAPAPGEQA